MGTNQSIETNKSFYPEKGTEPEFSKQFYKDIKLASSYEISGMRIIMAEEDGKVIAKEKIMKGIPFWEYNGEPDDIGTKMRDVAINCGLSLYQEIAPKVINIGYLRYHHPKWLGKKTEVYLFALRDLGLGCRPASQSQVNPARGDIEAGEELTRHYSYEYWQQKEDDDRKI